MWESERQGVPIPTYLCFAADWQDVPPLPPTAGYLYMNTHGLAHFALLLLAALSHVMGKRSLASGEGPYCNPCEKNRAKAVPD